MIVSKALRTLTTLTAFLFLLCITGWAQTYGSSNSNSKMTSSDKQFITKAAEGGKSEVELGQMAAQKAQSQEVKDFGQRMVNDHTKANDHLKQVAEKEGVTLPDRMDSESQALKKKLDRLSGTEFDKTYMDAMVKDHIKDVAEFKKEASMAQDPAVKSFAEQTLPTLEEHLKLAKQIDSKENQRASRYRVPSTE